MQFFCAILRDFRATITSTHNFSVSTFTNKVLHQVRDLMVKHKKKK